MKPIKLSELIETLEFDFPDYSTRVDLLNGYIVQLPVSLLRAIEEGDEKATDGLGDWQKEEVEIARAVLGDSGERFVLRRKSLISTNTATWSGSSGWWKTPRLPSNSCERSKAKGRFDVSRTQPADWDYWSNGIAIAPTL